LISDKKSSSRRRYIGTIGTSIGLLANLGVAAADRRRRTHDTGGKEKKSKLNYEFDPNDLGEVREFNSGLRNIVNKKGKAN